MDLWAKLFQWKRENTSFTMAEALQEFDTSVLQSETEPVINTAVLKINIIYVD